MFRLLRSIVTLSLAVLPASAFASPVFDFVLNYQSTTITFSLTGDVNVVMSNFSPLTIGNSGAATINGVGGSTIATQFYTPDKGGNLFARFTDPALSDLSNQTFAYSASTPGPDAHAVYLSATIPPVYAPGPTGVQISPGYWVYTYIPGTYNVLDYNTALGGTSPATLTITQEAGSPVPEPGTFPLLATGILCLGSLSLRQRRINLPASAR